MLLVPRVNKNASLSLIWQPLFFRVQEASRSSVSVSSAGEVFIHNTSTLIVLDLSSPSAEEALTAIPGFALAVLKNGCCMLRSQVPQDAPSPVSVSVFPTKCVAVPKNIMLSYEQLSSFCPHIKDSETVFVDLSKPTFVTLPSTPAEDFSIQIGPYGGHFVLTPLYVLKQAEKELPWSLALLSPSSGAQIQTSHSEQEGLLPTPPPSPPPMSASLSSPSSFPTSAPRSSGNSMTIDLPSLSEVANKIEHDVPPTPLSPTACSEPPLEETEHEQGYEDNERNEAELGKVVHLNESDSQQTHVSIPLSHPQQSIRGGLLRLFFAWIFRTLLARVCGFFGHALRAWGLPLPEFLPFHEDQYDSDSETDESEIKAELKVETEDNQPQVSQDDDVEQSQVESHERDDDHLTTSESFGAVTSPSCTTLADEDVSHKEFLPDNKLEVSSSTETVVPALEPPVYVSPHAPMKPRFLADVHSNTVSLLVRAPHSRSSLSELGITLGGKLLSDIDEQGTPGYTCSQLFENVYLLGLQGPQEGARLEVSVD